MQGFFDLLGRRKARSDRCRSTCRAQQAICGSIPDAEICFDRSTWCGSRRSVDQVSRDKWNAHDRSRTEAGKWIKGHPLSLPMSPEEQTVGQLAKLGEVQQASKPLYCVLLLEEELRLLHHLEEPDLAPAHLDAWLTWACRSQIERFLKLVRTIRRHNDGILAATDRLANGRLQGINSRIRLATTQRRVPLRQSFIALVDLCYTGIVIPLPR